MSRLRRKEFIMWTWTQETGTLTKIGISPARGYSGYGRGKNNPAMQAMPDVGPIPRGTYAIGPAFFHPEKGPCVMGLVPDAENEMFGRGGFLIHGDSIEDPGFASHGCIILDHETREAIANSLDRRLKVI